MIKVLNILWDINITRAGKALANFEKYHDTNEFNTKYLLPSNSKNIKLLKKQGAKIIQVDLVKNHSLIKRVKRILEILKREKPDIIHVHTMSSEINIGIKLYGKGKIIHTRHYSYNDSLNTNKGIKNYIYKKMSSKLYQGFIVTSEEAKQNLVNEGYKIENLELIEDGAERLQNYTEGQIKDIKNKYNINPNQYVISMIADLEKENGQEYLIDAMLRVASNRKVNAVLLIMGQGENEVELKEKVKYLGLTKNVKFLDAANNFEEILNISDIQVDISDTVKDYNSLILEGMSIGIPSVCSNSGINKKLIINDVNGFTVSTKDSDKLAERLEYLLINKHVYETIKNKSVLEYNNRFRADISIRKIQKYYKSFL